MVLVDQQYDPVFRRRTSLRIDRDATQVVIDNVYDIENVIELAKARNAAVDERARWNSWSHVAYIPTPIAMEMLQRGVLFDDDYITHWLNDPDNRVFRTRPGRV